MFKKIKNVKNNINPTKEVIILFFFYIILIILLIFINLILFTTIQIKITNLQISTIQKTIPKYKIQLKFYLCQKINYLKLNIIPTKIKRKTIQKNINKLKLKIEKNKNNFDIRKLKELKNLKPELKTINLKLFLGLEDASKTAICTGAISSIIAFFCGILSTTKSNLEEAQTNWKIIPIYQNKNLLNIDLNCIINIKLIHIIYTIYKFSNKKQSN